MKKVLLSLSALIMLSACNGGQKKKATDQTDNPLMTASILEFQAPDFSKIKIEHFMPAFEEGMKQQNEEIEAIIKNSEAPSFANTIEAMEKTGQLLTRTSAVFFGLTGADGTDERREVEEKISTKLSAHSDGIFMNDKLFQRVKTVYDNEYKNLIGEEAKLLQVYYDKFVQSGALLNEQDKETLKGINTELAELSTKFGNMLTDATKAASIYVDNKDRLKGMTEEEIASAGKAAEADGKSGMYKLGITNTTQQPILTKLDDRELRKEVLEASLHRTDHGQYDTGNLITRMAELRVQKAKLLGFKNFAEWKLQDQVAKTSERVDEFISGLVKNYTPRVAEDAAMLEAYARKTAGADFQLEAWDWDYYAEKLRAEKFGIDEKTISEYFVLDSVVKNGIFYMANKLYGLTFKERTDLPGYQTDIHVYDVFDADGSKMAIFYTDYYRRDTKSGGAWMGNWVEQSHLLNTRPVIYNVMNIEKPTEGQPALVSWDHVTTIFHEFGHALHGLFANQKYPMLSGTNVARDFVEMPSQFHEHWASYPEIFDNYAKHYSTGEPMPAELKTKFMESLTFLSSYSLGENMAAVTLDMGWHKLTAEDKKVQDVTAFEEETLKKAGLLNRQVPPRYRSSYFRHIWSNGYSAGYYAYLWSEVMDQDTYIWFTENGALTRENGDKLRKHLLSIGNTRDFNEAFKEFTGKDKPDVNSLLRGRGIIK